MLQVVEVTDAMLRTLMYRCGLHGFGYIDTCMMSYGCRWHVVERMVDPDGSYSIAVVGSFDEVREAFCEVNYRIAYRDDYAPEGWTSDYELWHVNEHRYFLFDGAHSFCDYVDVLPQWLYCVEDWDGTRIYTTDAEDWEDSVKLYGQGSVSSPTVKALSFRYRDVLAGAIEFESYFPVITVKCL